MSVLIEALRNAEAARLRGESQPAPMVAPLPAGAQSRLTGRPVFLLSSGIALTVGLLLIAGWVYLQISPVPAPAATALSPTTQDGAPQLADSDSAQRAAEQPAGGEALAAGRRAPRSVQAPRRSAGAAAGNAVAQSSAPVVAVAPSAAAPPMAPQAKQTPLIVATPPQEGVLALAYQAWRAGNFAEAGRLYEQVLEQMPGHPDALLGLAAVAERLGEREAAIAGYRRVLQADPDNVEALAALAELTAAANSGAQASALRIALARRPDAPSLHAALGRLLASEARWSEARQAFEAAYALAPQRADYAFNLAVASDRLGEAARARALYERAAQLAEREPVAGVDVEAARRRAAELAANR